MLTTKYTLTNHARVCTHTRTHMYTYVYVYMRVYELDLAFDSTEGLIYHKTHPNETLLEPKII